MCPCVCATAPVPVPGSSPTAPVPVPAFISHCTCACACACALAASCRFWFTFSSDPAAVETFYPRVGKGVIDQLLNWGPLSFVPVVPFVSWLLVRRDGVQIAMRVAACRSCWFRCCWCTLRLIFLVHTCGMAGMLLASMLARSHAFNFITTHTRHKAPGCMNDTGNTPLRTL